MVVIRGALYTGVNQVKSSLALVFDLNTHIYHRSGSVATNLEQFPEVMQAMQSLLVVVRRCLIWI